MRSYLVPSVLAATLLAAPEDAHAQVGDKPVCLRAPTGALSCLYESFAECRMLAKDNALGIGCVERPSTTGGPDASRPIDAPRPNGIDAPRGTGPNSLDRLPR
jgi:hypothetical protein